MKTLQNNFTTPEQSKRLLELGVPADSADCYLLRTHTKGDTFIVKVLHDELYSWHDKFTDILEYLPCWSVGRLIEISELCYISFSNRDYFIRQKDCNIEFLVKMFELGIDSMDFSKLED